MHVDVRDHIAAEVRAEMARQHKTQRDIAEVLNLPQQSVTLRVNGKRAWRVEEIVKVAEYLCVPVSKFLPDGDPATKSVA